MRDQSSRRPTAQHRRVPVALAGGGAAGVGVGAADTWQLATLVGWIAAAAILLAWTWLDLRVLDAAATRANAVREDDSRAITDMLVVGACVASLVAVGFGLHAASGASRAREALLLGASVVAIGAAWAVVHTVFALRYAHEYYGGTPGGIDFPGADPPTYGDFAYFAFVIGMTYQVSDAAVSAPPIRRTVLRHSLLAFLFGTAIIAASINIVAGFV